MENVRTLVAIMIVVIAVVLIATSGDSWAVRYVTALVSVDVAVRLARSDQLPLSRSKPRRA